MNNPFNVIEEKLSNIESLLLEIKLSPTKENSSIDRWLDLKELCDYHPDKPTRSTVYGWVYEGKIPVHKSAKKLRFLKSEIDKWLNQGRIKTAAEIATEVNQYLVQKSRRSL